MLGLASITSRIHALEQTVQRSQAPLVVQSLPPLDSSAQSHATVVAKLQELTSAFQSIAAQDAQLSAYLASVPALDALLESNASTRLAAPLPAALLSREEELVRGAADMFERTAAMLQQAQTMAAILDEKWPVDDLPALSARVQSIQSSLPRRAFVAAQSHVRFSHFLRAYAELVDLCNRQFLLWNDHLDRIEKEVDQTLAKQRRE